MLNSRYQTISRWNAHEHLILASSVITYHGKEIYITGGNDGCIAIWDVSEFVGKRQRASLISNGKLTMSVSCRLV